MNLESSLIDPSKSDSSEVSNLYLNLRALGDVVELKHQINIESTRIELSHFENDWRQYNPQKPWIRRRGLSVTSLDGGISGNPDLDSLNEHFKRSGIRHSENDFKTLTKVYQACPSIHPLINDYLPNIGRSHFIRLEEGGFFPPHRDDFDSSAWAAYRILVPLFNCDKKNFVFLMEDQRIWMEPGRAYFVNTAKYHSVFSFAENCCQLVLNIPMTAANLRKTIDSRAVR